MKEEQIRNQIKDIIEERFNLESTTIWKRNKKKKNNREWVLSLQKLSLIHISEPTRPY